MTSLELYDKINDLLGDKWDIDEDDVYRVVDFILDNFETK